jgi:single-stranded-DNA-specific exonuclease
LAVINPKNPADNYPFQFLTGVGVAFKFVEALFQVSSFKFQEKWLLDLVAIGTVADCQSLTGENRILVSFGLKVLAKTKWLGLKELLATASLRNNQYDTFTLGFILGPRINAAGRIKHGETAFKLLVSENPMEAKNLASELNQLNTHRQLLTEQVLSEAKAQIEMRLDKKVLLAIGKDWPKGVVGLVAGKLSETYNRPVLAISEQEGVAVGSARSTQDFDLIAALKGAHSFFIKYGGHKQAAGFSLENGNVQSLYENLLKHADTLEYEVREPVLEIDSKVEPGDINWENFGYLEKFAPFGIGNPKPKFVGAGFDVLDCRLVGDGNKHLKLRLGFGEPARHASQLAGVAGGHILEAISFGKSFLMNTIKIGQKIDCVFELIANEWNGNRTLQLKILDLKTHE